VLLALSACERSGAPPERITSVSETVSRKGFGLSYLWRGISAPVANPVDPSASIPARLPNLPEVTAVTPGSAAERAGFAAGDTLVSVNGVDARHQRGLFPDHRPGTRYTVRVLRRGAAHELSLVMGPLDGESPTGF
jgi:S1-C subfamily serine protease